MDIVYGTLEDLYDYYESIKESKLLLARQKFGDQVEFKGSITHIHQDYDLDPGLYQILCTDIAYTYFDGNVFHGT